MIARTWTAQARPDRLNKYLSGVEETVLPGLRAVSGYHGATFLVRESETAEILVITWWESEETLVDLVGADAEAAYVPDEIARTVLRYDTRPSHYAVRIADRRT